MTNANDELFEQTLIQQLNTFRVDGGLRRRILSDLRKLEKSLIAKIAEIDPSDVERFKAKRLRKLLRETRGIIDTDFEKIEAKMRTELTELASIEAAKQATILKNSVELTVTTTSLSANRLQQIYGTSLIEGAPSAEWWGRQSNTLKRNFEDQMRQGLLLGDTNDQLIRRVRGTRSFGYTNGIMNTTRRNSEALVRSSVQAVSNQARFEMMEANSDIIGTYRHVSTLDSRTSEVCVVRDSKRWKADTREPIGHTIPFQVPPIHWNCRSTLVAEVKGTQLPKDAERSATGGPVPANTDFKKFLDIKGTAFQDEVLGVGKAKLWRGGKITLSQLLDQQGNTLSLAELKKKYDN